MAKKQVRNMRTVLTAAQARKASKRGRQIATVAQEKKQTEAQANWAKHILQGKKLAPAYFLETVQPQIAAATARGQHAVSITVHNNQGENYNLSPLLSGLVSGLLKKLKGLGYTATSKSKYNKTFGSDDPYGNATYFTLEISW
ncbi:MAG: hypothetical protein WCV85_05545 [Patescibacteria group bacterium]|jgi:hypothetical protein